LVVDITETLEQKMDAVRCYASQFPESKAHVFDRVRTIAEHTGMLAGCAAGELFASVKMPCTKDLLGMLVPKRS
jgi:LmbE family N-acetylglucosaminyl deacetylase